MLETDTEDPEIMKDLVAMMKGDQPSLDEKGCGMGYLCEAVGHSSCNTIRSKAKHFTRI